MSQRLSQYPSIVGEILAAGGPPPLDAGAPNEAVCKHLAGLDHAAIVGQAPADATMADACLAGLWLWHGFLDESHRLSQEIHTPTGSYWHGIMHRREGDFDNAKYWFRRAGSHPVDDALPAMAREALDLQSIRPDEPTRDLPPAEVLALLSGRQWNASRFVDLAAAAGKGRSDLATVGRVLQQCEWQTLFDFCFRAARGER